MNKRDQDNYNWVGKIAGWGIGTILVIAPFYAPITVLLASRLQHFDLLRIWKEILLTGVGLAVLYFLLKHIRESAKIVRERLFQLVIVYALLLIAIAIYDVISGRVSSPAVIYGLMIHLRLVGFFMVVYLAFRTKQLNKQFAWWKFVLIPAMFVVGFGLMQMTILPDDALRYIGYGKQTIVPFQTVDNNPEFVRVQSTLRGPNPLGAYLLVIISITLTFIFSKKQKRNRKWLLIFLLGSVVVLFGTYSRSAALGLMNVLLVIILLHFRNAIHIKLRRFLIIFMVLTSVVLGVTFIFRNNDFVQTTVLHNSKETVSVESSNSQREKSIKVAARDVMLHPLGLGIGSAGPASLRNKENGVKLAENFYLQVGQEAGWLALLLFVAINIVIAVRLYRLRATSLAVALLASLVGLTFVNMLSHAWSDDTLVYVWWGLAGIALAHPAAIPDILNKKRK